MLLTSVPTALRSASATTEIRPRTSAYSTSAWPSSRSRRARRLMKKLFIATICYLPPVWISGPDASPQRGRCPRLGARAEPPLPLSRPAGLAVALPPTHLPLEWLHPSHTALEIRPEQQIE